MQQAAALIKCRALIELSMAWDLSLGLRSRPKRCSKERLYSEVHEPLLVLTQEAWCTHARCTGWMLRQRKISMKRAATVKLLIGSICIDRGIARTNSAAETDRCHREQGSGDCNIADAHFLAALEDLHRVLRARPSRLSFRSPALSKTSDFRTTGRLWASCPLRSNPFRSGLLCIIMKMLWGRVSAQPTLL